MNADERHRAVLELVEAKGSITVRELAEQLGVAAVTVRVDVRELARRGVLNRVHGGATRAGSRATQPGAERSASAAHPSVARTTNYTLGMVVPHASYYYPRSSAARAARPTSSAPGSSSGSPRTTSPRSASRSRGCSSPGSTGW
ncbi:DeoR family transcriptional regulator [Kribbella sp. DT2]|uniref:DeoR family transcriptional regulator n=1 Tax=Kribbella sp. DT2 TaxID=3393427 RepID=UPI003CE7FDCC